MNNVERQRLNAHTLRAIEVAFGRAAKQRKFGNLDYFEVGGSHYIASFGLGETLGEGFRIYDSTGLSIHYQELPKDTSIEQCAALAVAFVKGVQQPV